MADDLWNHETSKLKNGICVVFISSGRKNRLFKKTVLKCI